MYREFLGGCAHVCKCVNESDEHNESCKIHLPPALLRIFDRFTADVNICLTCPKSVKQ